MKFEDAFFDELTKLAKEQLRGGKGDGKDDDDFCPVEMRKGMKVEREHTKNKSKAKEIVRDHLTERPDYYKKLKKAGLADELKGKSKKEAEKED